MDGLVCPVTRLPVKRVGDRMMRADGAFYPVEDDIPILLGPEIRGVVAPPPTGYYAEAYAESTFYNLEAEALRAEIAARGLGGVKSGGIQVLRAIRESGAAFQSDAWLSSQIDAPMELDCWRHLSPIAGKRVVQLGGTGMTAVAFMLGGAASAILVTPMLCEARLARTLAAVCKVSLRCVVGIAEEIPLPDQAADIVYSGGCVHHMTTSMAFPEIARILTHGGRFAAAEPWRAPLYGIGTKLLGKREPNAFCRPLTQERVAPLFQAFSHAKYIQHGTLSRYPMLALGKFGVRFSLDTARLVGRWDDRISEALRLRRFGSAVALLACKQ